MYDYDRPFPAICLILFSNPSSLAIVVLAPYQMGYCRKDQGVGFWFVVFNGP